MTWVAAVLALVIILSAVIFFGVLVAAICEQDKQTSWRDL